LPFSKELYPINLDRVTDQHQCHPKTTMQYLLENMQKGGATNVFIIIRDGKFDIPSYFGDGSWLKLKIAYLLMGVPFGPPYTIDQAYSFVKDQVILFGFPDILVTPDDAFLQLINKLQQSNAEAVLGLHKVSDPKNWDMVKLTPEGTVSDLVIKCDTNGYDYAWAIMVWKYSFTCFLHNYTKQLLKANNHGKLHDGISWREPIISDVVKAAVNEGMKIDSLIFEKGKILDVGTPERISQSNNFFQQ